MSDYIKPFRTVGQECRLKHMADVAKMHVDSFEARQGYQTLRDWIEANKNSIVNDTKKEENEKQVLRGLLVNLLCFYRMRICHGDIKSDNVLINESNEVKLVGLYFTTCTAETLEKDYQQLRQVLLLFFFMQKDSNFLHLIDHFRGRPPREMRSPMYIFNAPCVWDTTQTVMVVNILANKMRRRSSGFTGDLIREATKNALESQVKWLDGTIRASAFRLVLPTIEKGSYPCLLKFMRDKYCHPPTFHGVELSLDQVKKEFEKVFPSYLGNLILELVRFKVVMPGDPIDKSYVGSTKFY